jgi:phosphoribosyl-ATP pyrophosphohydrolase
MTELMATILDRKANPKVATSYVSRLLSGGVAKIGTKIIEEAAEVVEAGDELGERGKDHLVREAADLVFHMMVLLGYRDLHWDQVEAELQRRLGTGGLVEKASRDDLHFDETAHD